MRASSRQIVVGEAVGRYFVVRWLGVAYSTESQTHTEGRQRGVQEEVGFGGGWLDEVE